MKHIDRLLLGFVMEGIEKSIITKTSWRNEHLNAIITPQGPERGIMHLLQGWLWYADYRKERFGIKAMDRDRIGQDCFLGPAWVEIGLELRVLLDDELGRLDQSTLDGIILDALNAEGFDGNGKDLPAAKVEETE